MARFADGQRVRVPKFNQWAPTYLYERVGSVTLVGFAQQVVGEHGPTGETVEQQYRVRFDDDDHDEYVWESWLEPA